MGKLLFLLIYSVHTLLPVLYKESAGYLIDTPCKIVPRHEISNNLYFDICRLGRASAASF